MAHLYLDERLESAEAGDTVVLSGDEARHAAAVARLRVGERTAVGNGRGLLVEGTVAEATQARVAVVAERVRRVSQRSPRILLAQALAKGGRDELAVQAATELGVDAIIPWQAERSVARWAGAKRDRGAARWAAIAREAAKQSMRPWLPSLEPAMTTADLAARAAGCVALVLVPDADQRLADAASGAGEADILLVVGPEGGMSPAELETLAAAGARPVRLGPEVLRTSTAGPAAIAALASVLERW